MAAIATAFDARTRIGDFVVRDLSANGALLVNGPELRVGTLYELLLQVPGLGPLRLSALTMHAASAGNGQYTVGVKFTFLSREVEEGLAELVAQELKRKAQPSVLVADIDVANLSRIANDLAELGERPLLAQTPLELLRWLADPETTVDLVLFAGDPRGTSRAEFTEFLRAEFPDVRSLALEAPLELDELAALLDSHALSALTPAKSPASPHLL